MELGRRAGGRATESILLAATSTGSGPRRSRSAISWSPGPQAGARVDDEHRDVGVGERRARLLLDRARELVAVVEVDAAGVDQRERAAVPLASASSLRSRVTPGSSCTTASRDSVRRLTSEDLPTFG